MSAWFVVAAILVTALSGAPGLFARPTSAQQRLATGLLSAGSLLGLAGAIEAMIATPPRLELPWGIPGGALAIEIDGISALFLVQIFLIAMVGSIYGLGYWKAEEHPGDARKLGFFYGVLTASLATIVIARNTLMFLLGWEAMAITAYFAVTAEDTKPEVREVGYVYLLATRFGALALFLMFALLHALTGDLELALPAKLAAEAPPWMLNAIFLSGVVGCGLKAGVMPLHVWLPGAHANAPSHVSALMSGVLIKMGIYGLIRVIMLVETPPLWWGGLVLALGAISGIIGVAFAIGQHDLKRLLAYHSVENIGIILIGLGLATMGRTLGRQDLVVLGFSGAILHVLNHGLFKGLLFLSAGSIIHATGTREIDHLGGLIKQMPRTALAFLIGAVAISGLPPLNGFVSELLIYVGLFRAAATGQGGGQGTGSWLVAAAFGAPALAMIGALAVACFVKVFGAMFLGSGRSEHAAHAHEAPPVMLRAMAVLALACVVIGLAPLALAPALNGAVASFSHGAALEGVESLAPLAIISVTGVALLSLGGLTWVLVERRIARFPVEEAGTWDCGYAAPSATMQYTASSFADTLVGLFAFALRPKVHAPNVSGLFAKPARYESHVPDAVLSSIVLPGADALARFFTWFRWLQGGSIQAYLLYVLIAVLVLHLFL